MRSFTCLLALFVVVTGCRCDRSLQPSKADLVVSTSPFEFSGVPIGALRHRQRNITNAGSAPLDVALLLEEPFTAAPLSFHLERGGDQAVVFTFTPTQLGTAGAVAQVRSQVGSIALELQGEGLAPCSSRGPCRTSTWNDEGAACVEAERPDDSACSTRCAPEGRCGGGECLSPGINSCSDGDLCTVDACSVDTGCSHPETECPSGPCTAGLCSPATGCATVAVEDGIPCGSANCAAAHVCLGGSCQVRSVPSVALDCSYAQLSVGVVSACGVTRGGAARCWSSKNEPVVLPGMERGVRNVVVSQFRDDWVCALGATSTICHGGSAFSPPMMHSGLDGGAVDLLVPGCWTRGGDLRCFAGQVDGGRVILDGGQPWRSLAFNDGISPHRQQGWCAVDGPGQVWCWGAAAFTELDSDPQVVPLPEAAVSISMFDGTSCAVLESGDAWCWGFPLSTSPPGPFLPPSRRWSGGIIDVSVARQAGGMTRGCALRIDGGLDCTSADELGLGVPGAKRIGLRAYGGGCVLTEAGEIHCWGSQLGELHGPEGITSWLDEGALGVDVSYWSVHVKLRDGGLVGAGWSMGESGERIDDAGLVFRTGLSRAYALPPGHGGLAAGPSPDGYGRLWVALADGTSWSSEPFVGPWKFELPGRDAGVVALTPNSPLCTGLANGEVWCDGDAQPALTRASSILELQSGVGEFAAEVCALLDGGVLACSGSVPFVPLTDAGAPERVVSFCRGYGVSCVVTAAGATHCSMMNDDLTLDPAQPLPGAFPGSRAVACARRHVCVISNGGGLQCWGLNLLAPNPMEAPCVVAQAIPLGEPARRISTDGETACAVLFSSAVKCWGSNAYGQRAVPRLSLSPVPRLIRY